jgi:hypothetical protein
VIGLVTIILKPEPHERQLAIKVYGSLHEKRAGSSFGRYSETAWQRQTLVNHAAKHNNSFNRSGDNFSFMMLPAM